MKRCVAGKKISTPDEENEDEKPAHDNQNKKSNPFSRGVMQFEDYNYRMFNPYILVDKEQKKAEKHQKAKDGLVTMA